MANPLDEDVPVRLGAALRRAYQAEGVIPPEVDGAVLEAAGGHFALVRRRRFILRWSGVTAAAAVLLVAATLAIHLPGKSVAVRGDINHDGRVDIVDAFLLAKQLQAGVKPSADADFLHDGRVDDRDVQILARAAVSLKPVVLQ